MFIYNTHKFTFSDIFKIKSSADVFQTLASCMGVVTAVNSGPASIEVDLNILNSELNKTGTKLVTENLDDYQTLTRKLVTLSLQLLLLIYYRTISECVMDFDNNFICSCIDKCESDRTTSQVHFDWYASFIFLLTRIDENYLIIAVNTTNSTNSTNETVIETVAYEAVTYVGIGSSVAVGVTASSFNTSSPTSLWTLFNQLQLLLLFILINTYIPTSVKEYIESFNIFIFNFAFIPSHDIPGLGHFGEWLTTEDASEDLQRLGVESISSFSNTVPLLLMIIIAIVFHVIVRVIPKSNNMEETKKGK